VSPTCLIDASQLDHRAWLQSTYEDTLPWPSASRFIEALGLHNARVRRDGTVTVTGEMRALGHCALRLDQLALVSSLEVVPV